MGPTTSTPAFLFLLILCAGSGAVLACLGLPTSGLILITIGLALFILHRLCVWAYRRQLKHHR